jgi:predicted short-subunit dehydrogenase-like oxidoreductase (DUF2520 family)
MDTVPDAPSVVIVGAGRAGTSLARALASSGWPTPELCGRDVTASDVATADVVVIATPDDAVAGVAATLVGSTDAAVVHLSGSLGLDVLAGHQRRASLHPLVSLPSPEVGAARLRGAWFAVAGDPVARTLAAALDGKVLEVADDQRAAYHAAACIASNHLVALMGQVERVANAAGMPLAPYLELARSTLDNVAELGVAEALTGPAARGDVATLDRHRQAIGPREWPAYDALVAEARRLASPTGDTGLPGAASSQP